MATKRIVVISTLLASAAFSTLAFAKGNEQPLDNIVAVVNDTVITQSELNQQVDIARHQFSADNVSIPSEKALRKQMLQHLINQKVQLEAASQVGIQVEDKELDKVITNIAAENHISVDEFYHHIAQEGLNAKKYRAQIRETLMLQHLQQQQIASRINVSQDEITDFLKSNSQKVAGEKEYHIEDILVSFSDTPDATEIAIAKKFAEDITQKLRKGTRLSDLATAETQALQDNDLSWRKLAEVPTVFTDPVVKMKVNEYFGPIQTSNGFHIVHLVDSRMVSGEHKLPDRKEVAQLIFQRKFEEALQGWVAKIRGQAFIVIQDKALA